MNLYLVILGQRIMELLALYLILANITGKTLKDALAELFNSKQRILYENIGIFVGYTLGIVTIIFMLDGFGYMLNSAIMPLVILFFVKQAKLVQAVLASLILIAFTVIAVLPNLIINLNYLINFILILVLVMFAVQQNYLYRIHRFLARKKIVLNAVYAVSLLLYLLSVTLNEYEMIDVTVVILLSITYGGITLIANYARQKELEKRLDLIANSTYDELILFLKMQECYYKQSKISEYFAIDPKLLAPVMVTAIATKLREYQNVGLIKASECRIIDEQIKISIIQHECG